MNVIDLIGKKIAVHCDTEEKASAFLEKVKVILPHDDYLKNFWCGTKEETCYTLRRGDEWSHDYMHRFIQHGYEVIKFEDLEEFKQ